MSNPALQFPRFVPGECLYRNPLSRDKDMEDFRWEGQPVMSFPQGALRLENGLSSAEGQKANYLLWCKQKFPADLAISFEFQPLAEPGLAMLWFRANGRGGVDLFDPALPPRNGEYSQYHSGGIDGYHASFFRRKNAVGERDFHTCNLRKSHGFHLLCQGADPLPDVADARRRYRIQVFACAGHIRFSIDDLVLYDGYDDGLRHGPVLGAGYFGIRQMAPLIAEYANLEIRTLTLEKAPV